MSMTCTSSRPTTVGVDQGRVLASPRPCPAERPAPPALPFHHPMHDLADFWIARSPNSTAVLLDADDIARHNQRLLQLKAEDGLPAARFDPSTLHVPGPQLRERLARRLTGLRQALDQGTWVGRDGLRPSGLLEEVVRETAEVKPADELRALHAEADLRRFPTTEPLYERAWDEAFDLGQCSRLHTGETVRVAGIGPRYLYVWSPYAEGWVRREALSAPIPEAQGRFFASAGPRVVATADPVPIWADPDGTNLVSMLRLGVQLPLREAPMPGTTRVAVRMPTLSGLGDGWVDRDHRISVGPLPFTRERVLRQAFQLLGSRYGWGDMGGTRDCSRFMMDLFATFGLIFPRNSGMQAIAGNARIDVSGLDEHQKMEAIEQAARTAVVLLYMKGHIMLFLGRDGDHLHALHQFSGYLVPCDGGGETMVRVNQAVVSSLELGRGSSRRAFIERISRLVILGPVPPTLTGIRASTGSRPRASEPVTAQGTASENGHAP